MSLSSLAARFLSRRASASRKARKHQADKLYRQVHEDMAARHGIVIPWVRNG